MSYRITFVSDLFKGPEDADLSHEVLQIMLDCLYQVDCAYLRKNPNTPRIYSKDHGVKRVSYKQEAPGKEDWNDIPTCLALGIADCEDLSCWLAAERTVLDNIPSEPCFTFKPRANGGTLYHIKVKRLSDGQLEDPSKALGM